MDLIVEQVKYTFQWQTCHLLFFCMYQTIATPFSQMLSNNYLG